MGPRYSVPEGLYEEVELKLMDKYIQEQDEKAKKEKEDEDRARHKVRL